MKTRLLLLGLLIFVLMSCKQNESLPETIAENPTPGTGAETAVPTPTEPPVNTAVPTPIPFIPTFTATDCPFTVPDGVPEGKVVCGTVTVPEDHQQPNGPTIHIAVAIIKDQSDDHQPDPVLVLSGGPGQKTLQDTVAIAQILEPLHPQRDLILFDQRGVGLSEPSLNCPEFANALFDNLDEANPSDQSQNTYHALMACRDRLVAEGHNLAAYNSWQNSADVEAIRLALGYEEVNLYGGSYGSHLAQVVMRDHPDTIRSVIIDSVYPLEISLFVDVATTSSASIMHLLEACTANETCAAAYPDLEDVLFSLVDQLNTNPQPVTLTNPVDGSSYEALLTGDLVVQNLRTYLYDTMAIPLLPQAIYDVANGDYELMTRLAGARLALFDRLSTGMEISVICTDDLIGKTPEDIMDNLAELPPQLAGNANIDDIRNYGIFAICAEWPVVEADSWVKEPVVSDIPTLVLSGEFDPVTPPEYAELAAAHLPNSYVFEFAGVGHNPVGGSSCARSMVADFLANPDKSPDASCMTDSAISFVVPTDYDLTAREPVYLEELDVSLQVPQGWTQVEPGVFASPDYRQVLTIISLNSDVETFVENNELTGPLDEIEVNGRIWTFYEFQPSNPDANGVDALTVAEDGTVYDVAVVMLVEQREEMVANVQMPAIESFALGEAALNTSAAGSLTLISYSSPTFNIRGIVPQGWTEAAPGTFQRGQTTEDVTTIIQKSYPTMSVDDLNGLLLPQLGLTELPEAVRMEANGFAWDVYHIEVAVPDGRTVIVEIAQAELNNVAYMVLLQAMADDFAADAMHDIVFMPAVEGLQLLSE